MDKITKRSTKVSLNGFNLQKENERLFLFRGDEQIGPFSESVDAAKICKRIVISKKCLKKR